MLNSLLLAFSRLHDSLHGGMPEPFKGSTDNLSLRRKPLYEKDKKKNHDSNSGGGSSKKRELEESPTPPVVKVKTDHFSLVLSPVCPEVEVI